MMVTESGYRPYAPPANVIKLLRRLRTRNLPEIVDPGYLTAVGFSKEIASRVLSAMRFLSLIKESGEPEDALRSLARSTDEEYKQLLEGILREAYRDVFEKVDPSQDQQQVIINAFRRFEPASQHYRMATLFLGLCREAGMPILEEPRRRDVQKVTQRTPRQAPSKGGRAGGHTAETAPAQASPVLWAYFQRLPKPGSIFPQAEQEAWLDAIGSAFRLEYQTEVAASKDVTEHENGE
jgi:hypothetical protein